MLPSPTETVPPSFTATATAVGPGPDLVVESIRGTLLGISYPPFEALVICVANVGDRPSGATFLVAIGGIDSFTIEELGPGESRCSQRDLTRTIGYSVTVTVDSTDAVSERDESNNTRTSYISWPTIPATRTHTRTPTPAPVAVRTTATAGPSTT